MARALAVMAAINGTGGYQTTLGTMGEGGTTKQSIADSRPNWEQQEMPALSAFQLEVDIEERDDEAQAVMRKLPLMFRGSLARGTDASSARKFLADILRAVRSAGDKWIVGGVPLAHHTEEGPHSIEMVEGTYEITGVLQQINIYYIGSHLDLEA